MSPPKRKKSRRQPRRNYRKEARRREKGTAQASQRAKELETAPISTTSTADTPNVVARRESSSILTLEPLSPVIVRSGRPMNAQTAADAARFPPPSTVAGCLRTARARAAGRSFAADAPAGKRADVHELARLPVAGPLLLDPAHRVLAPKPADALYFGHGDDAVCVRAAPSAFGAGCDVDLPAGLLPVRLTEDVEGKPGRGPAWWSWDDLLEFRLLEFRRGELVPLCRLRRNGWTPPEGDRRMHVTIDPQTGAAAAGQLFQTEGLDLDLAPAAFRADRPRAGAVRPGVVGCPPDEDAQAAAASVAGMRLLVRCGEPLHGALVHLGGKRRLAALEPEPADLWPTPPAGWLDRIHDARGLCLTLLTPGIFSAGFRPGWLGDDLTGNPPGAAGLRLRLRAAAVERWQPHSGWDLARRGPRLTRKLAPAGAVYWFDVCDGDVDALASLWLASVCDDEQDRRDGFGLALPGPWTPPEAARS